MRLAYEWVSTALADTNSEDMFHPERLIRGNTAANCPDVLYCPGFEWVAMLEADTGTLMWARPDSREEEWFVPDQLVSDDGTFRRMSSTMTQRVDARSGEVISETPLSYSPRPGPRSTAFDELECTGDVRSLLLAAVAKPWSGAQNCTDGEHLLCVRNQDDDVYIFGITRAETRVIHTAKLLRVLHVVTYWTPVEIDAAHVLAVPSDRMSHVVVNVHDAVDAPFRKVVAAEDFGSSSPKTLFPVWALDVASRRLWVANYHGVIACVRL